MPGDGVNDRLYLRVRLLASVLLLLLVVIVVVIAVVAAHPRVVAGPSTRQQQHLASRIHLGLLLCRLLAHFFLLFLLLIHHLPLVRLVAITRTLADIDIDVFIDGINVIVGVAVRHAHSFIYIAASPSSPPPPVRDELRAGLLRRRRDAEFAAMVGVAASRRPHIVVAAATALSVGAAG